MLNQLSFLSILILLGLLSLMGGCVREMSPPTGQSSPTVSLSPAVLPNSSPREAVSRNGAVKVPVLSESKPNPMPVSSSSVAVDSSSLTQPNANQLMIQNSLLATTAPNTGFLEPNDTGVFKRGQTVNLVLLKIGKFQKGDDGKNLFDLDIELTNSSGEVLEYRQELLGKAGHVVLPDNTAKSHVGFIPATVTQTLEPGTYIITMTVYDKISNQSVVARKSFTLE